MDQLRIALKWLQRYHFWVLSVVAVAVAIGCWYRAAGTLASKFQANRAEIEREFNSQDSLARAQFHANEDINKTQEVQINEEIDYVKGTWEKLYKRQRDEVLHWPPELDEAFHKGVESLKFGDGISYALQQQYFNYAKNHFPKLPEIVHARVLAEGQRGSRVGRETFNSSVPGQTDNEGADDDKYLVEWLDQAHVRDELEWPSMPSSLEIWTVQEDLWVYETLLQIVADTNEGATRRSNAAVRVIESLEVGRAAAEASASTGRLEIPQTSDASRTPGMGDFGPMAPEMPRNVPVPGASAYGSGGMGEERGGGDERVRLLSGRYLDKNGQPISVSGASVGPNEFGVEFKRLPVRMQLEMDVRAIPRLIANCTRQPLQVEVQQVRINPGGVRSSGSRQSNYGTSPGTIETFDPQPNLATVVIQGIIYIINEPDTSTLQVAGT